MKEGTHIKSTPTSRWWEYKKKNYLPTGAIVIGFIILLLGIVLLPLVIVGVGLIVWGVYKIFKNWSEYKSKK